MFSYKRGLCGNGGKWLTIVFTIEKNPNYVERYDLNGVFGTTPPSNSPDEPDEDAPSDSQKKGVPDDDDDGNFQPLDIGTENNQPSDKSTTSKKKKLDDEDEREEICMGFGDAAFDEFSLEELKALKTLAARCVSKEEVNFHAKLLPYKEAMEFATSEFLRQLILECDANRTVRNLYKYLLAVLKNKVREKMSDC
jgi:hypothetical protein